MARPAHPLRHQFEAALLAHIEAHGGGIAKSPLVQEYVDRGVSAATVYRWIETVTRRRRLSDPAGDDDCTEAPPIVSALPAIPSVQDIDMLGAARVLELLRDCIKNAEDLMQHARSTDGRVRNARLLLYANDSLRRVMETAAKLNDKLIQQGIQSFHRIVMEEIRKEPSEIQEKILVRVRAVSNAALAE